MINKHVAKEAKREAKGQAEVIALRRSIITRMNLFLNHPRKRGHLVNIPKDTTEDVDK